MAGVSPHPRAARRRAHWPRDLHRSAWLLGLGAGLYWSSFAFDRIVVWVPPLGTVYVDLLLAWVAVLVQIAAWPGLWAGLRDLRARNPRDASPTMAWRAFLLALALVVCAIVLLPLEYHGVASAESWLLLVYVTAFPFVAWASIPTLALHGILFGRVANYLDAPSRRLTDLGAFFLFAVSAASVAVILEQPDATSFVRSWAVGRGLLPATAFAGYALISIGMTLHAVPAKARPQRVAAGGR